MVLDVQSSRGENLTVALFLLESCDPWPNANRRFPISEKNISEFQPVLFPKRGHGSPYGRLGTATNL